MKTKTKIGILGKIRLSVLAAWCLMAILCFCATPMLFRYSYVVRGYRAVGGEILVPFIPFISLPQFMNLSDILCGIAKRLMKKKGERLYRTI